METNDNTHTIDKVVSAFRKAATEMEEFQLQFALGKAEAHDKYEEVKKKFNLFVHDTKAKLSSGKDKLDELHTKFDELRVQLALGKAETKEAFQEQKKKLMSVIHDIETKIKYNKTLNKIYAVFLVELEKFKVQLSLMGKKFEEGKENVKESFQKGKDDFNKFIDGFKERFSNKEETRWDHFQDEISEAFTHFKEAFVKP